MGKQVAHIVGFILLYVLGGLCLYTSYYKHKHPPILVKTGEVINKDTPQLVTIVINDNTITVEDGAKTTMSQMITMKWQDGKYEDVLPTKTQWYTSKIGDKLTFTFPDKDDYWGNAWPQFLVVGIMTLFAGACLHNFYRVHIRQ